MSEPFWRTVARLVESQRPGYMGLNEKLIKGINNFNIYNINQVLVSVGWLWRDLEQKSSQES